MIDIYHSTPCDPITFDAVGGVYPLIRITEEFPADTAW